MSEKPLPPQYGNYYGQEHLSDKTVFNINRASDINRTAEGKKPKDDFLSSILEEDRKERRKWRGFKLIASVTGVAVVFVGAIAALVVGPADPIVGVAMGGMSTVAGTITATFVQLVRNPEKELSEQIDRTQKRLMERDLREEQRREVWMLLGELDEKNKQEVINQLLLNPPSSAE